MDENENDYITKGNWDSTGITLSFNIPEEDKNNPYILYPVYNISKRFEADGIIQDVNVVLIFFKKRTDPQSVIRTPNNEFIYNQQFNYSDFSEHASTNPIKLIKECDKLFVIFFHDDTFDDRYVKRFFDNLTRLYKLAADSDDHIADDIPPIKGEPIRPKRAGMSILRK